ncbi:hypothetical protein [Tabrizicola sp.]|uniref:hypothetical protein n=1 Tax=Tabrizicola sp. TaxID=2005166 RepID=UPI003F36663D
MRFTENINSASPPPADYTRISEIPNIGISSHRSAVGADQYFVTAIDSPISPRVFQGANGETRWAFDHSKWPKSVVMRLGGLWLGETLLPGLVDTLHDTVEAQDLMKRFLKSLKKEDFTKVSEFWIGKEAMEMLKSGKRLATAAHESPPEFDLKLP